MAAILGPLLLLASTVAYVTAGEGMNDGEVGGAIQVWAMILITIAAVGLTRMLEDDMPRGSVALFVLVIIGGAAGVGFGIDSMQVDVFDTVALQESDSALAPIALNVPGLIYPLAFIALGVSLFKTGAVSPVLAILFAVAGLLFPASRIADVTALALIADGVLVVALGGIGLSLLSRPAPTPATA